MLIFQVLQQVKLLLRELCAAYGMEEPPDLEDRLDLVSVPQVINGNDSIDHVSKILNKPCHKNQVLVVLSLIFGQDDWEESKCDDVKEFKWFKLKGMSCLLFTLL